MHEGILRQMRALVRRGEYSLTDHAEAELDADELTVHDIERAVLAGFVADRQRDPSSGEWKYVIEGPTTRTAWLVVVAKISVSGKLWILTVFRL
jgi:hypothetical protein